MKSGRIEFSSSMAIGLKLRNLLYVIHAVDPAKAAPLMPPGLELDLRPTPQGERAFVATVVVEAGAAFPYIMTGFRQINYRIYVRHNEQPGALFVRSWVSSRAAAAAMNLAIPTEHAHIQLEIQDHTAPYSQYRVEGRSGTHQIAIEAAAAERDDYAPFASHDDAVHFLLQRHATFAAGAHPKGGLAIVRVNHPPMDPLPAQVHSMYANQWTDAGLLSPEEVGRPLMALIQPEIQFDMNLPEKID